MSAHAVPFPAPRRATSNASVFALQALAVVLAVACAALGLVIAQAYPIRPMVTTCLFGAWFVFAALRPSWSLFGMLGLLPVLAFAPWTGWLLAEEFDLLLLATAGGGYAAWVIRSIARAAIPPVRPGERPRVSLVSGILVALFLGSTVIALVRGIESGGGYRFDWYATYDDALNSLRVFKSFFWVVLLLPLITWEARRTHGLGRIALGIAVALGLCALAVVQERFLFVGLLDFSDDYRATGPFWEMHIGGAGLDGFLAMTIPFAIREALRQDSRPRFAAAVIVLGLAAYASLVTFSRGVYAAVPASLFVLAVLLYWQRPKSQRGPAWPLIVKGLALVVVVAVGSIVVFRAGGYRAALALLTLFAATILVEPTSRRADAATWIKAAVIAAVAAGVAALVASFVWKGPYLAFACATAAFGWSTWQSDRGVPGRWRLLSIASYLWMAAAACHVAGFWGGSGALRDCVLVTGGVVALALLSRLVPRPLWPTERRQQIATIGVTALVSGAVVVFIAGAYMSGRIATSSGDLDGRIAHWSEGIGRIHGLDDWVLGKGLGRFPSTSLYDSPDGAYPGSYRFTRRDGESFVALTGPRIKYLDFGELFRLSQRVDVKTGAQYSVRVEARAATPVALHVEVCEKHLLYHGACSVGQATFGPSPDGWQTREIKLSTDRFGSRPVFFATGVATPGATIELKRIRMIGPGGIDVIENGDFGDRTARWFSSSDKWHLPFHIKSLALDVLFDQGLLGLALFALLVGGALLRVSFGRARRHPDAPFIAASIVGFVMVGAFDSLLDMPRVAFLFYFVVMLALIVRNPALRGATPTPPPAPKAAVTIAPPATDDAAARAERRRMAFGERRAR